MNDLDFFLWNIVAFKSRQKDCIYQWENMLFSTDAAFHDVLNISPSLSGVCYSLSHTCVDL